MQLSPVVAEDDRLIQDMIELALAEPGFEAAMTATGEAAVSLLRSFKTYSAFVTEIDLGGIINGWEIARAAREIGSGLSHCLHDRRGRRRMALPRRTKQNSAA